MSTPTNSGKQAFRLKRCSVCKLDLPRTEFSLARTRKDGLKPWCIACTAKKRKEYAQKDQANRSEQQKSIPLSKQEENIKWLERQYLLTKELIDALEKEAKTTSIQESDKHAIWSSHDLRTAVLLLIGNLPERDFAPTQAQLVGKAVRALTGALGFAYKKITNSERNHHA